MEYEIYRADELYHHGIRGMKWGIRRYQNKDGSLTPRGKKRYEAELKKVREQEKVLKNRQATKAKIEKLEARKKAAADEQDALDAAEGKKRKLFGRKQKPEEPSKKSIKDMSDVELFEAINRARMEDTYRQLRPEVVEKSKPFKKLVDDVVTPAATNAGKQFLENALKQAGAKLLEGKVDPDSIEAMTKMRDKLKLKNEIEKLKKNDPDDGRTWKDRKEELEYTKAKEKYDTDKAKAAEKATEDARKANEQRSRAEYETTGSGYRYNYNVDRQNRDSSTTKPKGIAGLLSSPKTDDGRQYAQSTNTWSGKVAGLLDSPKIDSGRKYLESDAPYSIEDRDGNVLLRFR